MAQENGGSAGRMSLAEARALIKEHADKKILAPESGIEFTVRTLTRKEFVEAVDGRMPSMTEMPEEDERASHANVLLCEACVVEPSGTMDEWADLLDALAMADYAVLIQGIATAQGLDRLGEVAERLNFRG